LRHLPFSLRRPLPAPSACSFPAGEPRGPPPPPQLPPAGEPRGPLPPPQLPPPVSCGAAPHPPFSLHRPASGGATPLSPAPSSSAPLLSFLGGSAPLLSFPWRLPFPNSGGLEGQLGRPRAPPLPTAGARASSLPGGAAVQRGSSGSGLGRAAGGGGLLSRRGSSGGRRIGPARRCEPLPCMWPPLRPLPQLLSSSACARRPPASSGGLPRAGAKALVARAYLIGCYYTLNWVCTACLRNFGPSPWNCWPPLLVADASPPPPRRRAPRPDRPPTATLENPH
ncbi:unnamed protein product, partial [Urochloa humidicola]